MRDRLTSLLELLGHSPDDAFLLYAIAQEYVKLGEIQKAADYFARLREVHPTYVGLYYHLGKLEQQRGHRETALQVFKKGLDIAKSAGDMHAWSELQRAVEELDPD